MLVNTALVEGEIYAVALDLSDSPFISMRPLRPLKAVWQGGVFHVIHPEHPHDPPFVCQPEDCRQLGRWSAPWTAGGGETWAGAAAHALGQVLRQHALVERLQQVGIIRAKEPYIHRPDMPNAVERSVVLNYDELDMLLTRAGV